MLHVNTPPKINKKTLFIRIYLFFIGGLLLLLLLLLYIYIQSLRSQSWDIAQYPEIVNQSNCATSGGSRVAHTNILHEIFSTRKTNPDWVTNGVVLWPRPSRAAGGGALAHVCRALQPVPAPELPGLLLQRGGRGPGQRVPVRRRLLHRGLGRKSPEHCRTLDVWYRDCFVRTLYVVCAQPIPLGVNGVIFYFILPRK